ncbi:SubName: Full=Uncharacterized protein {ECO:0000313/EMBL:CCA71326.1} [Serendipita indica DSM 11827]|nr:SubName: Full=Uncharacterized protein {ECO:0000313/EMBL:CCA71326.1} [Serendipita indica DSM 11827]
MRGSSLAHLDAAPIPWLLWLDGLVMLHFRIQFQHEIKAFLVPYDAHWTTVTEKVTELFDVPPSNVALIHRDRDGSLTTIHNQDELRSYLLGPKSARAVAGLPLDFDLKDLREWKYSIISHIPMSEIEDTEEHESITEILQQAHTGKFTDEDYTFINRPPNDPTDVQLVIPGEETPYAVPRHLGIGASPNMQVMQLRQEDDNSWDKVQAPSERDVEDEEPEGTVRSVDYPHLEEPTRPQSVASSGPPRIPSRDKGKGRAMSTTSLDPVPLYSTVDVDVASNRSVINNDTPKKPTIQIPEAPRDMGPIPLISNIVKKMSLESGAGESTRQQSDEGTYGTLITQLVSLVDVVTQLLEDDGVAHQLRGTWEGMALKSAITPMSAFPPGQPKPKELALAEGIVKVMKRVQTIVEEDPPSDIEEQDGDVIWTHRPTPSSAFPKTPIHTEKRTAVPAPASVPAAASAKSSKQRLEEAKALYKAEKARYRAEREQRRRNKLESRGYKYPDVVNGVQETDEPPIEVKPAPPGHRASLMSAPDPDAYRGRASAVPHSAKAASTVKPAAGSTYSPALLPTTSPVQASIGKSVKSPSVPSMREADAPIDAADSAHDGGSEGPGTPKPAPARPQRASTQFDFDAFMEANAWNTAPRAAPGWVHEQAQQQPPQVPPPPAITATSTKRGSHSLVPAKKLSAPPPPAPPPRIVHIHSSVVLLDMSAGSENTAPTPPPRPHAFSPSYSPPDATHGYPHHRHHESTGSGGAGGAGLEQTSSDAFRANLASRGSVKGARWGAHRRIDVGGREDSLPIEAHPPPVYSTDGEGGDELIESGGPPARLEKGALPLNEEFKRRCLAVLHEYNVTQDKYPNLDVMITQGIQIVGNNRQMMRLAAESNAHARETILSEEVPNVVNRVLAMIQRGSSGNYV